MRIIMARLLFNFDMKLAPASERWLETQKAYFMFKKPTLNVFFTPARA
jgi:hypothetical protein